LQLGHIGVVERLDDLLGREVTLEAAKISEKCDKKSAK
jgi:hypothetical protein